MVKSVPQNFVNTASIIESFGRINFNNKSFRTFQSPHRHHDPDDELDQALPNSYSVTITSLRLVVEALADKRTPVAQRKYFIARSAIPGARFVNDILENPDDVIPVGYLESHLYTEDLRKWESFIGACRQNIKIMYRRRTCTDARRHSQVSPVSYSSKVRKVPGYTRPHRQPYARSPQKVGVLVNGPMYFFRQRPRK